MIPSRRPGMHDRPSIRMWLIQSTLTTVIFQGYFSVPMLLTWDKRATFGHVETRKDQVFAHPVDILHSQDLCAFLSPVLASYRLGPIGHEISDRYA
jgi:hypothetical protein